MKYHERNEDGRFVLWLVLASVLAFLVIAVPATSLHKLLVFL